MPKHLRLSKKELRSAELHLSKADTVMQKLIAEHGICGITLRKHPPFHTLVSSIISQQLSNKAASTIKARIVEIVSDPFLPENFHGVRKLRLRKAGLSDAKVKFILDLARHIKTGKVKFDDFHLLNDEEVITTLMAVKGIGRWTAEMFLIFSLHRPNVMALSDAGLRRSIKLLYGENVSMEQLALRWQPYCSVAAWYLWRHLDAKPKKSIKKTK